MSRGAIKIRQVDICKKWVVAVPISCTKHVRIKLFQSFQAVHRVWDVLAENRRSLLDQLRPSVRLGTSFMNLVILLGFSMSTPDLTGTSMFESRLILSGQVSQICMSNASCGSYMSNIIWSHAAAVVCHQVEQSSLLASSSCLKSV